MRARFIVDYIYLWQTVIWYGAYSTLVEVWKVANNAYVAIAVYFGLIVRGVVMSGKGYVQRCVLLFLYFVSPFCIAVQNILVDCHCQCRDIFLCPHYGDTGYGVFISNFDSALRVDRGREKLERSKLYSQPIKYSVHSTPGYRPPEVGEEKVSCMGC